MTVPATSDLPTRYDNLKLKTSKIPGYEPGIPLPETSISYWMGHHVGKDNVTLGAQSALPAEADVVIVGGGSVLQSLNPSVLHMLNAASSISGALTAYWLLKGSNPPKKVVLLEARWVCQYTADLSVAN